MKRWLPWALPVAVFAVVQGMVLSRIAHGTPLASYNGGPGAQFHTHAHRLWSWGKVSDAFSGQASLWTLPLDLDGDFPPVMHVVTGLLVAPFGHSLEAATASGMLWVALLAAAMAVLGTRLGGTTAGVAAATGILLLPSLQSFSVRYYFDIPMTALLWLGIALLVAAWDGPRRGVVGVGVLLALAALTKWTAVVFGGLSGLGLLWMTRGERRRWTNVALAGAVAGGLGGLYGGLSGWGGSPSSFAAMFDTFEGAPPMDRGSADRWAFYPLWLVRSVVTPALTVPLLGLLGVWLARGPVAAPLVGATVLGQLLWLTLSVPVLDERFALTLVPALILAAALGLAHLPQRPQLAIGLATVVVGVAVCWDAHFGRAGAFPEPGSPWELRSWRQLGMDNAWNTDGAWARGETRGEDCQELRAALWELVERDDLTRIGVDPDAPVLRDHYWWAFKSAERSRRADSWPGLTVLDLRGDADVQRLLTPGAVPPRPDGWARPQQAEVLSTTSCPTAPTVHVWVRGAD